jgi:hypothetical protein
MVANGRRQRGVTPDYRRRALPGPPPLRPNGMPAAASASPRTASMLHAETRERLRTVLESRSWRLTSPLRALGARIRRLRSRLGR